MEFTLALTQLTHISAGNKVSLRLCAQLGRCFAFTCQSLGQFGGFLLSCRHEQSSWTVRLRTDYSVKHYNDVCQKYYLWLTPFEQVVSCKQANLSVPFILLSATYKYLCLIVYKRFVK